MALPFLSPLIWAAVIALIARPLHMWLRGTIRSKNVAAAAAVVIITIAIIAPAFVLVEQAIREAADAARTLQSFVEAAGWRPDPDYHPRLAQALAWLESNFDLRGGISSLARAVSSRAPKLIAASVESVISVAISLFTLFYFVRDGDRIVAALIRLLPLSPAEIDALLTGISDAIRATIYGRFTVAAVQGMLGGIMFWILGIGAPMLWGMMMVLLSLVPLLGAFIIWAPAAIVLLLKGSWVKALILTVWGGAIIGLIDNFLYPLLVGDRLQVHSLLVFFSVIGGMAAYGATGIILGPVVLSLAIALQQLWQQRAARA
jgi:predicted PurR-regulated permease PerM